MNQSDTNATSQPVIQLVIQSVNQWINHSDNQSVNQLFIYILSFEDSARNLLRFCQGSAEILLRFCWEPGCFCLNAWFWNNQSISPLFRYIICFSSIVLGFFAATAGVMVGFCLMTYFCKPYSHSISQSTNQSFRCVVCFRWFCKDSAEILLGFS